ncbi:hypothetical protein CH274_13435 [Rhodococcus sp. 06-418-5]|uniref:DNA-methyltransferase n=1 Tax=Rhodococcus sp. 06-418-5 TaxID=2022507 RepID=UPI000B9AEF87|nr:site-specific DNA-methyltransferase [Rhodococcus sp. 06-418-5]OZC80232.1 hypothetical protein CH274_13435 [Rhodococcus sp. 06-418-5]
MTIHYVDDVVTLHHGDCLDVLRTLEDCSVDSVVTDPPYGISFMGKEWDGAAIREAALRDRETRRSLGPESASRPGRTKARSSSAYGNEAIIAGPVRGGREFQEWCEGWATECLRVLKPGGHLVSFGGSRTWHRLAAAVEDSGFEIRDSIAWLYGSGFPKSLNLPGGLGTALKPAFEPIVVGRKKLAGTVAMNVLAHGTGALNIDACRVGTEQRTNPAGSASSLHRVSRVEQGYRETLTSSVGVESEVSGRWPMNVTLDESQVDELDRQSGTRAAGGNVSGDEQSATGDNGIYGHYDRAAWSGYGDTGGASRFFPTFRYEAKAPASERPSVDDVQHPTVKPLDLMRWLVRLVTPPNGVVLEPFAGSGTTAEACVHEHMRCIAIEREADYLPLIVARLSKPIEVGFDFGGIQ